MKILLIDDEKKLTDAISTILKQNKYSVDCANESEIGLDLAVTGLYDLIILDVMMPVLDGFTLLKTIRNKKIDTPVLMLSAKGETEDKIVGLECGADDYLSKPFNTRELIARIKALLRRKSEFMGDIITYSDVSLNRDTFQLVCGQETMSLGKKEFQIMEMLILSAGKSIRKETFIEKIWGYESDAEYNTIEVYVSFLRKKLSAIGSTTEIKSIRGVGYSINSND